MWNRKALTEIALAGFAVAGFYMRQPTSLLAQTASSTEPAATAPNYTQQQWRGDGLFLQRCSICHLARKLKNVGSPPTVGPDLSGIFANATPDEEKTLRTYILKGSPNMPGFQYGLEPKDIDDLIAYLMTKK
jgi:mono/diheme cytochrome c family protein